MKELDLSIVFKMRTVEDLGNLHKALEQTMTLQEKLNLEQSIKELKEKKRKLQSEIRALGEKRDKLLPEDQGTLKDDEEKELEVDALVEAIDPQPSENEPVFIEEPTEEPIQERESEDNVQGNLET